MLLPGEGLQQDVLLAGEVVHHLARAHAGPPGYLGEPDLVYARLSDQVQGRLEHAVPAALALLRARWAAPPRRWSGDSRCRFCHGRVPGPRSVIAAGVTGPV